MSGSTPQASNAPEGPWGLPPAVLTPGKVITDPVHSDIHLNKLEVALVDSRPFQRLRRIRQLGNTHLVYPGAVHTRFSHSLGALRVAQILLETVWAQAGELHGVEEDLFAEWRAGQSTRPDEEEWERATALARLGALLHDLCHVPAGHTVEDELKILEPHDKNKDRFDRLWNQIQEDLPKRLLQMPGIDEDGCASVGSALLDPDSPLYLQLRPLVISKYEGEGALGLKDMEYPFCADLVGNTICADLLDYLDRDHLFTGLPESLGRRFVAAFFVTPSDRGSFSQRLALNILRGDHERTDVVSELLKALRYRYELSERALVHHAKLSADAMLGESIERWEWALWWFAASQRGLLKGLSVSGHSAVDAVPARRMELERKAGKASMSPNEWERSELGKIETEIREAMEEEFRQLGDEGLLDFLAALPERGNKRLLPHLLRASASLAEDLRDRRLFRVAERVGAGDVSPDHVFRDYGSPAQRAKLEAEAQHFAGLDRQPRLILWIPPPDMRLKLAEVLVQQKSGIAPFVTYERSRSRRGSDIYDAHGRLWAAYVFVHRDVSPYEEQAISAFLGQKMGIRWERHRYMGGQPDKWPLRLAIAEEYDLGFKSELDRVVAEHEADLIKLAAKRPETLKALRQEVARSIGPLKRRGGTPAGPA